MLREFEQLSYAEIAELVKVPVNTVRSRLFRARMALKECLEPGSTTSAEATPAAAANVEALGNVSDAGQIRPLTRTEREAI